MSYQHGSPFSAFPVQQHYEPPEASDPKAIT